jgi:threonine/homoserine/homoserine lactone efflux protein
MLQYIKAWCWGFLVSFVGSIPLGSLNSLTVQISHNDSHYQALLFAIGIAIAEVIHVSLTLVAMKWILKNKLFMTIMEWFTIVLFSVMAISCFYSYFYPSGSSGNVILDSKMHKLLLGFSLSLIDLLPIPFWFLWTNILIRKKRFEPNRTNYQIYTLGIFIGTICCQGCYILLGNWLLNKVKANSNIINLAVGIILVISIIIQLYKKARGKNSFDNIEKQQQEDLTTP